MSGIVSVPPVLSVPQQSFNATADYQESVTFTCITSGSPDPQVTWHWWVTLMFVKRHSECCCLVQTLKYVVCWTSQLVCRTQCPRFIFSICMQTASGRDELMCALIRCSKPFMITELRAGNAQTLRYFYCVNVRVLNVCWLTRVDERRRCFADFNILLLRSL